MVAIASPERAELHVSASQIKTYLLCPRKYQLRYVLGAPPEHRSIHLAFGSAIHEALAAYYMGLRGNPEPPSLDHLCDVFTDSMTSFFDSDLPIDIPQGQSQEDIQNLGIALLGVFHADIDPPQTVLAVEQPFAIDICDPTTGQVLEEQLIGFLDALVEIDGKTVIVEHKTAGRKWSQDQLDHDLQTSIYLAAIKADHLRLQTLVKTTTPKLHIYDLVRTPAQKQEAIKIICGVLTAIRAGAFWPQRGWMCCGCEFSKACAEM